MRWLALWLWPAFISAMVRLVLVRWPPLRLWYTFLGTVDVRHLLSRCS